MNKNELWDSVLATLSQDEEPDEAKMAFINLLSPLGIFGDQFILIAHDARVAALVQKNYLDELQEAVDEHADEHYTVSITTTEEEDEETETPINLKTADAPQPQVATAPATAPSPAAEQDFASAPASPPPVDTAAVSEQPSWMDSYLNPQTPRPQPTEDAPTGIEQGSTTSPSSTAPMPAQGEDSPLFSRCTFDTFVVGKSNEFARSAAVAVAEAPGTIYNPLFIYGDSGLGKTHLLISIANYVQQNYPLKRTTYISANDFLNDFVQATQTRNWDSFNDKYHRAEILLIDDVQYLEGKDETINQFFNIFNEMTSSNKQIVLSADRSPKDINMDERMRSRFLQGLIADISAPDYETRLAILKNYLQRIEESSLFLGTIPEEVLQFVAETSTSNIREMEGAITRLVSNITLGKRTSLTLDEAKEILQDFFPDTTNKPISIETIQHEVEQFFQVSHEDIISSKRSKGITTPRHIAIYLSRYLTEESLETIGKKFGGRDHTTVMYSVNKIEQEQKNNRMLYEQLEQLMVAIREKG